MNLSQPVTELLYRLQLREFREHLEKLKRRNGTVWVSDLVYCPLKYVFRLKYLEVTEGLQFQPSFIFGDLIHKGLEEILLEHLHEVGFSDVRTEVEVEKRINVDLGGLPKIVRVSGRLDVLARDRDGWVVIEIKASKADLHLPHEHHVLQLRIYMNMVKASRGLLVYITPDRIAEYWVNEPLTDEELQALIAEFLKFKGPKYDWECRSCFYAHLCPNKVTENRWNRK